jgi:hypothetical protein
LEFFTSFENIHEDHLSLRVKNEIFRLVEKKNENKIEDGQNRWLSATRAFISVRRVFQSEPDFHSAVNAGGFFIYFSVL